ncbi:MAG: S-methyl-5-thioribose kinase [Lachnospiraceae bacterium]|nr:S-methyl-5-thioribose kinase [Lachnospiraceae bacterium]
MYDKYFLMSESDIEGYIREKLPEYFDSEDKLVCKEIGDGNLNYVFRLVNENGKSIIIKQAGEELRISKDLKLSTDRGRIEANVLRLQAEFAPGYVPKVFLYDEVMCVQVMEDMIGHGMMRTELLKGNVFPLFAEQISDFLAKTLILSGDIVMNHMEKKKLVGRLINPDLCDLTEHLVFSEPYSDYNNRNNPFEKNREFIAKNIYSDESLKARAAELKYKFMNNADSLIHGDLHTGSIFINKDHLYVFDPEFAFYGPAGYDIGNILANLLFAYEHADKVLSEKNDIDAELFKKWILDTVRDIIDLFLEKSNVLYDEKCSDIMADNIIFKNKYMEDILKDTAGYAGTEIIRRIVGMAKVKDITSIEDEEKRAVSERKLLLFAKTLMSESNIFANGKSYVDKWLDLNVM